MRRIRTDNALSAIPSNGHVEVFQPRKNASKNAAPQGMPLSLLGSQTAIDAVAADLAAAIAGNTTEVTATVDGTDTGLIPADAQFIEASNGGDVNNQISLPAAVGGKRLVIYAISGCELISAVAADKVNNVVVGGTNEAALVAGTLYELRYNGADNWVMTGLTALGAVETPVVPDALV